MYIYVDLYSIYNYLYVYFLYMVLHGTPEAKIQQSNASQQPVGCRILSLTLEIGRVSRSHIKYNILVLFVERLTFNSLCQRCPSAF